MGVTSDKIVCVMDTDSLLFSFKLDCFPKRVIKRFDEHFNLFFPRKVFEEYKVSSRDKTYDDVRLDMDLFLKQKEEKNRIIEKEVYSHCVGYVERFFNLLEKQKEYHSLGEGEKHAAALGIYMSHRMRRCLVVMTDDFRAREAGIDFLVSSNHVGLLDSLLGAMTFIYCVSTDISQEKMQILVNDYFELNPPKHESMVRFKERILKDVNCCCRTQSRKSCSLGCLNQGSF